MSQKILVAGATGNLGGKIVSALLQKNAEVSVVVRKKSEPGKIKKLQEQGVKVYQVDLQDLEQVTQACLNKDCVVSALSGLREVVIDTQKILFNAAVAARVPRFIPSDYSLDFTNLVPGGNRNLDLRREFHAYIANKPIQVTTIFNGAFMDLITTDMPLILFNLNRILYWGSADHFLDLTTTYNVAAFTANAALDDSTPRYLHIAGDQVNARQLKQTMTDLTGKNYKLLKAGNVGLLKILIKIAQKVAPGKNELYPAWQGMQYMKDMMEGRVKIDHYDNHRYPEVNWTTVKQFLISEKVVEKYK